MAEWCLHLPYVNKSTLRCSERVVPVFSCRQAKESPSPSPRCSTPRRTLSFSDTEGSSDTSLGLCSETHRTCRRAHEQRPRTGATQNADDFVRWSSDERLQTSGVTRRLFFQTCTRTAFPVTHYSFAVSAFATAAFSAHKTVQTNAGRSRDIHSARTSCPGRPLNIVFFPFYWVCRVLRGTFLSSRTRAKKKWILSASAVVKKNNPA